MKYVRLDVCLGGTFDAISDENRGPPPADRAGSPARLISARERIRLRDDVRVLHSPLTRRQAALGVLPIGYQIAANSGSTYIDSLTDCQP